MSAAIIANLLQNEPLYRKVEIEKAFWHPHFLHELKFQFYCQREKENRTFKFSSQIETALSPWNAREAIDFYKPFKSNTEIEYFYPADGVCQSCDQYAVHFLLHVFSEGPINRKKLEPTLFGLNADNDISYQKELGTNSQLMIRKVGQWPRHQLKPDTTLYSFLDKEDKENYNKALMCLNLSYGVGAFAYLRKIVEREIIRIVEELIHDSSGNSEEMRKVLREFKERKQMSNLIDSIFPHLPNSLKVLGDNPIKLLYGYLSDGLHNQPDEVCLTHAIALDKLLQFTVKRLREDQTEIKEIREVMKGLRSGE